MEHSTLKLLAGTSEVARNGTPGVSLHGRERFASDTAQTAILRALFQRSQTVDELLELLRAMEPLKTEEGAAPLTLASFILDFGTYLET